MYIIFCFCFFLSFVRETSKPGCEAFGGQDKREAALINVRGGPLLVEAMKYLLMANMEFKTGK